MRVTRSAKAMPEESDAVARAGSGVFDESLMASDVPQATHGGKGGGEDHYAPRPIANDLPERQLSKVSVHLVGLVG